MNSIKKNNKGFTLIELLITIVIIGIVAVPFLNSFIQAMNNNVRARRLQNATLAAQSLAEEFKADTLSDLLEDYAGKYTISTPTDGLDVYTFSNIKITGADGEDFYLNLELDPNVVTDSDGNVVNGVSLPLFSSLYGGNTLMIFKQYVDPDPSANRATSQKVCDISVKCKESSSGTEKIYTYTVDFSIYYILQDGSTTVPVNKTTSKSYKQDELQTAYLLAPVFDTYSVTGVDLDGNYYATDKINISYEYDGNTSTQPEFTFYFAEQTSVNKSDGIKLSRINPANVTVKIETEPSVMLESYNSKNNKFKINTNVGKRVAETVGDGTLTYSEDNIGKSLFLMNIEVRYGSETGEVLTTFTTTKEE